MTLQLMKVELINTSQTLCRQLCLILNSQMLDTGNKETSHRKGSLNRGSYEAKTATQQDEKNREVDEHQEAGGRKYGGTSWCKC